MCETRNIYICIIYNSHSAWFYKLWSWLGAWSGMLLIYTQLIGMVECRIIVDQKEKFPGAQIAFISHTSESQSFIQPEGIRCNSIEFWECLCSWQVFSLHWVHHRILLVCFCYRFKVLIELSFILITSIFKLKFLWFEINLCGIWIHFYSNLYSRFWHVFLWFCIQKKKLFEFIFICKLILIISISKIANLRVKS